MPDTPEIWTATEALLSGLVSGGFEYALIGGLAVVLQGHDRYTQDVDALVWDLDSKLEAFVDLLHDLGFSPASEEQLASAKAERILHMRFRDGTAVDISSLNTLLLLRGHHRQCVVARGAAIDQRAASKVPSTAGAC